MEVFFDGNWDGPVITTNRELCGRIFVYYIAVIAVEANELICAGAQQYNADVSVVVPEMPNCNSVRIIFHDANPSEVIEGVTTLVSSFFPGYSLQPEQRQPYRRY